MELWTNCMWTVSWVPMDVLIWFIMVTPLCIKSDLGPSCSIFYSRWVFDTENTEVVKVSVEYLFKTPWQSRRWKEKALCKKARIIPPPAAETVKYLPATKQFPFSRETSHFNVKEAVACWYLKNNLKKGQLYFSIVSCQIKSYLIG